MLKKLILILFLILGMFNCEPFLAEAKAEKCKTELGYTEIVYYPDAYNQEELGKYCYNPKTKLSYEKNAGTLRQFFYDGKMCGLNCDYDGNSCSSHRTFCNPNLCVNGYTYKNYIDDSYACSHPTKNLHYIVKDGKHIFYIIKNNDSVECGKNCDFDGKNCEVGICNTDDCPKGSSLEYKDRFLWCFNQENNLLISKYSNDYFGFQKFIDNSRRTCGKNCKPDGSNCETGLCSLAGCAAGYSEFDEKKLRCINPKTKLAYSIYHNSNVPWFYISKDEENACGKGCDFDGLNCETGICNIKTCRADKGYTEFDERNYRCVNPKTQLAYASDSVMKNSYIFYLNGSKCGIDCDMNGQNCKSGGCDISRCDIQNGYNDFKNTRCYNPVTKISYEQTDEGKIFFHESLKCGVDCDMNGKNCKIMTNTCNVEECTLEGYTQLVEGYCTNSSSGFKYSRAGNVEVSDKLTYSFWTADEKCTAKCNRKGQNCRIDYCHSYASNIGIIDGLMLMALWGGAIVGSIIIFPVAAPIMWIMSQFD